MASPSVRRDLKALRNLINQADLSLALVPEHPSITSARESLNAALALSKDLVNRFADSLRAGAAAMGAKGGSKTAERGPEYFAQIACASRLRWKRGSPITSGLSPNCYRDGVAVDFVS